MSEVNPNLEPLIDALSGARSAPPTGSPHQDQPPQVDVSPANPPVDFPPDPTPEPPPDPRAARRYLKQAFDIEAPNGARVSATFYQHGGRTDIEGAYTKLVDGAPVSTPFDSTSELMSISQFTPDQLNAFSDRMTRLLNPR